MTAKTSNKIALHRMFDALSPPHRRRIRVLVSERNPREEDEFSVEGLASEDEDDDLELLAIERYHAHRPKLAEAGYIEWDRDTYIICRGPKFDEIAPLRRLMDDHQDELPKGWPGTSACTLPTDDCHCNY